MSTRDDFAWLNTVHFITHSGERDDDAIDLHAWLDTFHSVAMSHERDDDAIDILFDRVDDICLAGDWLAIDSIITGIKLRELSDNLLVALLSITWAPRAHLRCRGALVESVEVILTDERKLERPRIDSMLRGLR